MRPNPPVPDQPGAPSPGLRLFHKRSILSKLAPLMGLRASGTALVQATGGAVTLPAASYAAPILQTTTGSGQSQIDWSRLVKVGPVPDWTKPSSRANPIEDITIDPVADPGGTLVPIYSMLGGSMHNATAVGGLAVGTELQWDPPITGIEARSTVSVGMSGGTDFAIRGALKRIVLFDRLGLGNLALKGGPSMSAEAWRAKIGDFPAGVLILMGTRKAESGGRSKPIHSLRWRLLVLTSTVGPAEERIYDGDATLDWAEGLLENSGEVDGQAFSIPRAEVGDSNLLFSDDAMNVHHLDFTTSATFDRIEPRTFVEWSSLEARIVTDPTSEYPDPDDAKTTVDIETTT